ncbi:sugar phosphate nucleotidyltransferase [candidate division CSSED10-310 bacterium]|uniref:UTP--glucose-1-phosphate uridylyltransferase n=1 Tax=candidate division CSSED10-310 bacterium TaxID=2855610 RepID=A0ABV6YUZ8_UNCC1
MKALIPAAGLGTRWYPWSKILPKELLPLGKFPAIHYCLEEIGRTEITQIGIIINERKELIRKYVNTIWKPEHPDIQISWFYQSPPRGVADALICARSWIQNEPVAVLYPDEIHPLRGGIIQLCTMYEFIKGHLVGLTKNKQNRRQGVLKVKKIDSDIYHVQGSSSHISDDKIAFGTGRYIIENGFNHISKSKHHKMIQDSKDFDDDCFFKPLWQQNVKGIFLNEPIYDVGTPENWSQALNGTMCAS